MCEWLSCEEWCDVQLVCGGHAFNAHRAVLASVSTFLREILLSCAKEETPTFIVLPDFDIEAMSSVIHYIYNGEVTIQKQKLEMFMDIVKAMEIFIDHQYLQQLHRTLGNHNLKLSYYHESKCIKTNDVFSLSSGCSKNQQYVNLRKGESIQDIQIQCSLSNLNFRDKQTGYKNWWMFQHSLENLPSPYADRQRSTFLRDLFIETYPRNGNANGLTSSVLAISNERYHAPTSVLLTNANGKYPRTGDTVSEISIRTTEYAAYATNKKTTCTKKYDNFDYQTYSKANSLVTNTSDKIANTTLLQQSTEDSRVTKSLQSSLKLLPASQILTGVNVLSLDLRMGQSISDVRTNFNSSAENSIESTAYLKKHNGKDLDKNVCSINKAGSVLNQVMESPWSPRLPKDYRPFRKKTFSESIENKMEKEDILNDGNNNIQQIIKSSEKEINVTQIALNGAEDFKCTVCNQGFITKDRLTMHTCRNSTTARYSCGECGKTFSQLRNFKYHMSVHRGTREFAATCTVCGKYFNDRGYLSSHMKIHKNRKEYKCTMCPKSFNQRVAYNMHVRIHTGVKPHVCEQCGKAFSRKMLLKQHQRTHSGERPYACSHCDKRFADRSNMTLHLRLHTGVKPFSCTLCPKSFTKKHHLKSHLNFHTGAKPYSCPRCKLAFTQSSNMRTHFKKCNAPDLTPQATSE
ncbi:zinc finger protein 160-like [Galleria mellonella]|uniref:Zinc finger protein 160-like n=1 Tax=Galleria mellonella TaxID=7137 RepID=A0A6J1WDK9_GALME|nr:zinc finger protein 160-like [Galleria mellonella]